MQPRSAKAWLSRSRALQGLGNVAEALDSIGRALAIKPSDQAAQEIRGSIDRALTSRRSGVGWCWSRTYSHAAVPPALRSTAYSQVGLCAPQAIVDQAHRLPHEPLLHNCRLA